MQKTNLSNHLSRSATANNLGLQWMKILREGNEFCYKNQVHGKKKLCASSKELIKLEIIWGLSPVFS